jgi:hypothetical protein
LIAVRSFGQTLRAQHQCQLAVAIEVGAATGPDDAFEDALLNAHTGASLASTIGLTHVTNPEGSRTYLVDLVGIAAGICAGRQHNRYHFASFLMSDFRKGVWSDLTGSRC